MAEKRKYEEITRGGDDERVDDGAATSAAVAMPSSVRLSPSLPPNDSLYCWGSLPRKPVEFGASSLLLPFLRKDGVGVYSTIIPGMYMRAAAKKRQKMINDAARWSPWNGEATPPDLSIGGFARIIKFLGGGTYGKVFEAEITSREFPTFRGKRVAIKFFALCQTSSNGMLEGRDRFSSVLKSFYKEAEITSAVHNDAKEVMKDAVVGIMGTFAYMTDPATFTSGYYPALVMELARYGSVSEVLKRSVHHGDCDIVHTIKLICSLASKMCTALERLHSRGFYQQDVKPSNFLCFACYDTTPPGFTVKLGDMGLACTIRDMWIRAECQPTGTTLYVAPELVTLRDRNVTRITDPRLIESSERFSLACSVRDMFWIARRVFPIVKKKVQSCWGQDKRLARKRFVRQSKTIFNKACMDIIAEEMREEGENIGSVDVLDVQSHLVELDRVVWSFISEPWERRPPLCVLESIARETCLALP